MSEDNQELASSIQKEPIDVAEMHDEPLDPVVSPTLHLFCHMHAWLDLILRFFFIAYDSKGTCSRWI